MRILSRIALLATVCSMCIISGCIQAEPTLILKEDGTGTFDVEYSISEQAITQFKAMLKLRDALASASNKPLKPDDPLVMLFYNPSEKGFTDFFSKYANAGIKIEQIVINARNASKQVHIRLNFESLTKVAETDLFTNYRMSLQKTKNDDYTLKRDGIKNIDTEKTTSLEEQKMLTPLLSGFKVTARVNTPGTILRSNATKTSRFTAQWDFNYDRNPKAISDIHESLMEITFSNTANKQD